MRPVASVLRVDMPPHDKRPPTSDSRHSDATKRVPPSLFSVPFVSFVPFVPFVSFVPVIPFVPFVSFVPFVPFLYVVAITTRIYSRLTPLTGMWPAANL